MPISGRMRESPNIGVVRQSSSVRRTGVRFLPRTLHALILNDSRIRLEMIIDRTYFQ